MKFCNGCGNMYYLKMDGKLTYYCRNCGNEDEKINECYTASKNNIISEDTVYNSIINKYTKNDETIPRVNEIKCINTDCASFIDSKNNILLIRNDEVNMKFIYLCGNCDTVWKSSIK
tara:strand:+ start:129 stop:479 length:351 start_codon:yes stop_codon:yes gene_type:complete